MRDGTVTWRLELPLSWGGRWDPSWLPTGDPESWRRIYVTEDRAGRVFAAGGAGLHGQDIHMRLRSGRAA